MCKEYLSFYVNTAAKQYVLVSSKIGYILTSSVINFYQVLWFEILLEMRKPRAKKALSARGSQVKPIKLKVVSFIEPDRGEGRGACFLKSHVFYWTLIQL